MAIIKIQSENEKRKGICYQFESTDEPIGEGGMGKVYKGLRVDLNNGSTRPVAIKFMYDDLPSSAYERARREAEIQLRNDNLVEMLGFIETEEKDQFGMVHHRYHVVSELLSGVSLSSLLEGNTKDRSGQDVPFAVKMLQDYKNDPTHFARTIVMGVLSGLMALHDAGYIHRDIDPSNIMLTTDGHIKLIVFGICKQLDALTAGDRGLTEAGTFLGKPEYAAPELAIGDLSHQNQTTDIYAMGILLFQCIVGHTPFEGDRTEVLNKQLKSKLPLSIIKDRRIRGIIATACEKKQESRYQSAAQMRVALETMNGGKHAVPTKIKIGIAAAVAVLVVGIVSATMVAKHNRQVAEEQARAAAQALEQQQQAEREAQINTAIERGRAAINKSLDHDTDDYELALMDACTAFQEAVTLANGTPAAQSCQTELDDAIQQLTNALATIRQQEQDAADVEYDEGVEFYRQRADAISDYLNKHKNQ